MFCYSIQTSILFLLICIHYTKLLKTQVYILSLLWKLMRYRLPYIMKANHLYTWPDICIPSSYQMFWEVQLLTRTDIYKKTRRILESYSENILTTFSGVDNPINTALQEEMKHYTDEGVLKYQWSPGVWGWGSAISATTDISVFVAVSEIQWDKEEFFKWEKKV